MNFRKNILMIRTLFLLTATFLLTSFGYREPNYCKMADRITKCYVKEFAKPRRLMLSGYGGAMMDDIQIIDFSFLSFDALNVEEARILYVEMMEEFLRRINSHEKNRPHLHNFPFEVANIKLSIAFEDSERKITSDGHIALMFIGKNQDLVFRGYNAETDEFYSLHREPYSEASKIVIRE